MITIIAGVLILGVLIFIHELGHFCVAKLSGVKVLTFSLGFGPRVFGKTVGDTEYRISAIPLGGYVQMLGEGPDKEEGLGELSADERQQSFADKPLSRRFAIVAAGPLMNLILPFLVLPWAYMVGVQFPAYLDREACVGYVIPDTPAVAAGFESGDCIQAISGTPVISWHQANQALITHAGQPIDFAVVNQGQGRTVSVPADQAGIEGLKPIGLLPPQEAIVGLVSPGLPAETAGVKPGDRIVRIDNQSITSWYQLRGAISSAAGQSVDVEIVREGESQRLTVKPVKAEGGDHYLFGIAPFDEKVTKKFGLIEAFEAGADQAVDLIQLTVVFIQKLFTGNVSAKNVGGPITVFQFAGQAAKTDFSAVLTMLAFLSIQLGILNLLPIPVLDGGHLFFYALEFVFRKPLSQKAREVAQQIGLSLLLLLMGLAFYNDISRLFF